MKYYKRGQKIDPKKHNVGESPSMLALNNSKENLLHHTTYNRQRELLNYSGAPENRWSETLNLNGEYDCSFYIIYPVRGETGDKIRIGYSLSTWKYNDATGNCNFKWDGVASDKLADTSVIQSSAQTNTIIYEGEVAKPEGISVTDDIELDYDHQDFTGYGYTKVSFERLNPASFVSWIAPMHESDYNAIDPTYGSQAFHLSESAFNIDQTLRGSSANDDSNGSVGTLCQKQLDDDTDGNNMVSNSDLCLFQYGHPAGLYVSGGATIGFVDAFRYNIKIKGRELNPNGESKFDVIIIYRANSGASLNVLVDSTGTDYSYTLQTATSATPTGSIALTDIPFDGSGDELTIRFNVSADIEVELKSIAIFETTY